MFVSKETRVKNCMIELYTYCVRNKNMYGILTSVNKSWLFKCYKNELYVSKLFEKKDLLQQVYNIMNLSIDDPDPDSYIPPYLQPGLVDQDAMQSPQTSSSSSSNTRRSAAKQNAIDGNSSVNLKKLHLTNLKVKLYH